MCNFCSKIFDLGLLYGRFRNKDKKALQEKERDKFIEWKKENGKNFVYTDGDNLGIFVETGDMFQEGYLEFVKYCPMCGRKL